jgi:hypothetical protein
MTLTKREKTIAVVVGAVVSLFLLDQVIIEPYINTLMQLNKNIDEASAEQAANQAMFDKQAQLKPVLDDLQKGGLTSDESAADAQASQAALNFAQNAGITINSVKPERTTQVNQFQVIGFHISGVGSTWAIARMMYAFETASVPIRVDELVLSPMREGTNSLKVELTFSTICQKSAASTDKPAAVSYAGASEVQSWNE